MVIELVTVFSTVVYVVLVMVVLVIVLLVLLAIVLLFVVFVIVRWERRSGVVHGAGNSGVVCDVGNSDFSNGLIRGAGDSELDLLVYLPLVVPS